MSLYIGLRRAVAIAGLIGCCGAAVALSMMISDPDEIGMCFPALSFLGAFSGGIVAIPFFGHADGLGWLWAFLSALLATYIGSAVAIFLVGVFITILWPPLKAILAGPGFVFAYLVETPLALVVWVVFMTLIHLQARRWRERV